MLVKSFSVPAPKRGSNGVVVPAGTPVALPLPFPFLDHLLFHLPFLLFFLSFFLFLFLSSLLSPLPSSHLNIFSTLFYNYRTFPLINSVISRRCIHTLFSFCNVVPYRSPRICSIPRVVASLPSLPSRTTSSTDSTQDHTPARTTTSDARSLLF